MAKSKINEKEYAKKVDKIKESRIFHDKKTRNDAIDIISKSLGIDFSDRSGLSDQMIICLQELVNKNEPIH